MMSRNDAKTKGKRLRYVRPTMRWVGGVLCLAAACWNGAVLVAPNRADAAANPGAAYVPIDLGSLGGNWMYHEQAGINDKGDVVGASTLPTGEIHAFLWHEDHLRDLGTLPGARNSTAMAINNQGQVVGVSGDQAVLWQQNRVTALPTPTSYAQAWAYALNDQGDVVGRAYTSHNDHEDSVACLWPAGKSAASSARLLQVPPGYTQGRARGISSDGKIIGAAVGPDGHLRPLLWEHPDDIGKDVGTLSGDHIGMAMAINAHGEIVGDGGPTPTTIKARLWQTNHLRNADAALPLLDGYTFAKANAINTLGQVVGDLRVGQETVPPFLYEVGVGTRSLRDLMPPRSGWDLRRAFAINRRGEIVCWGSFHGQTDRLCLLRPVSATAKTQEGESR